jgi:hypothetical protein
VEKFRKPKIRDTIEAEWDQISTAIMDVLDFVRGETYIRCDKALPSNLVLIPLIYMRYHYPLEWRAAKGIDMYPLRSLLSGVFGLRPDQLIDDMVRRIKDRKAFDVEETFSVIKSSGRSLEITEDRFSQPGAVEPPARARVRPQS